LRDAPLCIILVYPTKENTVKLEPQELADIEQIKATRARVVSAISHEGKEGVVNARIAIIAMAEVIVPLALMLTDGNRAATRDLIGGLLDETLDGFTTAEMEAKRKALSKKYGGVMTFEDAVATAKQDEAAS
jgi:hypothetical protein